MSKGITAILFCFFAGCAAFPQFPQSQQEAISWASIKDQQELEAEVKRQIPVGTKIERAKEILEANGFDCEVYIRKYCCFPSILFCTPKERSSPSYGLNVYYDSESYPCPLFPLSDRVTKIDSYIYFISKGETSDMDKTKEGIKE